MTTLYESRVHQIDQFAYAAFGLTVAPYAIMSLVNLVVGLFCPDFEELYLLKSSILEEARSRPDAQFGEVAGDLVEYEDGSVVAPETCIRAKVVNVDVIFGLDEKAEQRSASITIWLGTMARWYERRRSLRAYSHQYYLSPKPPLHPWYGKEMNWNPLMGLTWSSRTGKALKRPDTAQTRFFLFHTALLSKRLFVQPRGCFRR